MEGNDLEELLNKVLLEDFQEFMAQFDYTYCLVDEDGYSIDLLYSNKHMAVYYYHRQKKEGYISILGVVDWKIELLRFLSRIQQFFGTDFFELERRVLEEAEELFLSNSQNVNFFPGLKLD